MRFILNYNNLYLATVIVFLVDTDPSSKLQHEGADGLTAIE